MASYSNEFKEKMVGRLLPPNNEPVSKVSKETNISIATLHKWKNQHKKAHKESMSEIKTEVS